MVIGCVFFVVLNMLGFAAIYNFRCFRILGCWDTVYFLIVFVIVLARVVWLTWFYLVDLLKFS